MHKVLYKLLFITLFTNLLVSQEKTNKYIFIGHAYGSPNVKDNNFDPSVYDFLSLNKMDQDDYIVFGGDMISDCSNKIEINELKNFLNLNNSKFVIGNHDLCPEIISLSDKIFGGDNYFERINSTLIFYINSSFTSELKMHNAFKFISEHINMNDPQNVIIFSHQVIFSKNDFYLRTNSRQYYNLGNKLYDKIFNRFNKSSIIFHLISGDIGAFKLTPYAFYDKSENFNLYASGLGNLNYNKAIFLKINDSVNINFIDLNTGNIELKKKYSKIKVQIYQLPKLLASRIKFYLQSIFN